MEPREAVAATDTVTAIGMVTTTATARDTTTATMRNVLVLGDKQLVVK